MKVISIVKDKSNKEEETAAANVTVDALIIITQEINTLINFMGANGITGKKKKIGDMVSEVIAPEDMDDFLDLLYTKSNSLKLIADCVSLSNKSGKDAIGRNLQGLYDGTNRSYSGAILERTRLLIKQRSTKK